MFVNSKRWGQLVRKFTPPRNPQTPLQQKGRQAFGALASQWRALSLDAQSAWYVAADRDRTGLSGYHYFMKLNASRIHLGLTRLTLPPASQPSLPINPVGEAVAEGCGESLRIKLHVPSQPAQYTLVEVAAPVSTGVRNAQGYRYLSLLPAPDNGWSDITAQVVARFGVLTPGKALFIRTRQQIDGWMDTGKVTRVVIPRG